MASVKWTKVGSPGEVVWARTTGEATVIVVGTEGGQLYLRRRDGAAWRWERLGTPPGALDVSDAALLTVEGSSSLTPAVVGDDLRVWLHRPEATPTPWIGLGGPEPDVGQPHLSSCGDIVPSATGDGAAIRHTLVVSSASGRPWIREGVDPGATWFKISPSADWIAVQLATALASVAAGSEPQLHIFAVVLDRETGDEAGLRIGMLENSVWTWIDPDGPSPGVFNPTLSATSFRDDSGRLQACAAIDGAEDNTMMLIGSGRDWRWVDLGKPPDLAVSKAVVAAKSRDPQAGAEPVVVARAGHHIWTRSLTGDWTDLGTTPQDVVVVEPFAAFEAAEKPRVWAAGVSWRADLWTFESDDAGVRWENHRSPGAVVSVVGAHTGAPPEPGASHSPVVVHVIDEHRALWNFEVWGSPTDGFFTPSSSWTHHGQPTAGITCVAGVGTFSLSGIAPQPSWAFVVGSDGHLWARTAVADIWSWVDHGAPAGRSVEAGVGPIAVDLPGGQPAVHVLGDDGRLWMRSAGGDDPRWIDRGVPEGQLIFGVVGATAAPSGAGLLPIAVVITGDGHLWVNDTDGVSFRWHDLGAPAPTERIVAGLGMEVVAGPNDSFALEIAVRGSPSGQVWSRRWEPSGVPAPWVTHGRPADARIRAAVGTLPDPANPTACLIAVVGNDQQVWVTSSATPGVWTRWDPPPTIPAIVAGKAMVLLGTVPSAVVMDSERRVTVVTLE
jgi:hypothetical protein